MAMERFVDENYTYLNGNVEAMGKILRKFDETFTDVKGLRQQVRAFPFLPPSLPLLLPPPIPPSLLTSTGMWKPWGKSCEVLMRHSRTSRGSGSR